jgi:hypothetical protein
MSVKSQQTKFSLEALANWDKQSHEKLAMHKRTIAHVTENTALTGRKDRQALHTTPTTTVISTSH